MTLLLDQQKHIRNHTVAVTRTFISVFGLNSLSLAWAWVLHPLSPKKMWPHRFDSFVYYSTALGPLSRQKHTMRTWKDNKVKYNYQPVRQTWADWHRRGGV